MRFYDVSVNQSVPTEVNRGLTSYKMTCINCNSHNPKSTKFQKVSFSMCRSIRTFS
jgi:hypothetical protein